MVRIVLRPAGAGLACLLLICGSARADALSRGVLDELNFARTQPQAYADVLMREARSGRIQEPPRDVYEAIDFLRRQQPLQALRDDTLLDEAALAYADRQGSEGGVGHTSSTGESFAQRLHRFGVWTGMMAEDISYGWRTPRDVVRQLIVDSGVADRGHRTNIFGAYQAAGVGCAGHRVYGALCVVDFTGDLAGAR
jgi:uncharacterized protein YkwD